MVGVGEEATVSGKGGWAACSECLFKTSNEIIIFFKENGNEKEDRCSLQGYN